MPSAVPNHSFCPACAAQLQTSIEQKLGSKRPGFVTKFCKHHDTMAIVSVRNGKAVLCSLDHYVAQGAA